MLGIAPRGELQHPWIGLMQLCSLCGDHSRHRDAVRITALKPPEGGHQRKFSKQKLSSVFVVYTNSLVNLFEFTLEKNKLTQF